MKKLLLSAIVVLSLASSLPGQTWQQLIGYEQLINEFGLVANGNGVTVDQVEAPSSGNYLPNTNDPDFTGKTFTVASGPSGISNHATAVGQNIYGNNLSIAGGVTSITNHEANNYISSVLNWVNVSGGNNGPDPILQPFNVANHSWIGNGASPAQANGTNILQRLDYVINRTDTVVVVGENNTATQPQLLSQAYNVISVGVSSGAHSVGPTTIYGPGRVKPEIVAPAGSTSIATARVSSAAAMLSELATGSNAAHSETMKAILLAGATKEPFSTWDQTTTRPLDERFGAGQLNVYNSYRILAGGEFDGSTATPTQPIGRYGWDFGTVNAGTPVLYDLDLTQTTGGDNLSILLNWNIDVTDTNAGSTFVPVTSLANLDLRLLDANGFLVQASLSTVDNLEHIYLPTLSRGRYTIQVTSNLSHDYALAWRVDAIAIPEPGSWIVFAVAGVLIVNQTRRKRPRNTR